jgi:hypothetical protein
VVVGLRDLPQSEDSMALATHAADTEGGAEREPAVRMVLWWEEILKTRLSTKLAIH